MNVSVMEGNVANQILVKMVVAPMVGTTFHYSNSKLGMVEVELEVELKMAVTKVTKILVQTKMSFQWSFHGQFQLELTMT